MIPDSFGAFGRSLQERSIPFIRSDVITNEIPYIDFFAPKSIFKGLIQFYKINQLVVSYPLERANLQPFFGLGI